MVTEQSSVVTSLDVLMPAIASGAKKISQRKLTPQAALSHTSHTHAPGAEPATDAGTDATEVAEVGRTAGSCEGSGS